MTTLLFLLMFGCAKHDKLINSAKWAFRDNNCLETLKAYVRSAGCEEVLAEQKKNEIIFRCKKPDDERGKFYDNYWFRISPAGLTINEDSIKQIEAHTICIDEQVRIEAYAPE